jgi:hypothetical protein
MGKRSIAWEQGNRAYREMIDAGISKKIWLGAGESGYIDCPKCQANVDAGAIPLKDKFPSGHLFPPAHKDCRCCVLPVVDPSDSVAKVNVSEKKKPSGCMSLIILGGILSVLLLVGLGVLVA